MLDLKILNLSSDADGRRLLFRQTRLITICLALTGISTALADVRLSPLFSDGAVLQRGKEVPIWGMADPGESVAVRMNGKQASGTADSSGRWSVKIPAQDAGGPFDFTVQGKNTVVLRDIVVGEVWVASGQSNMQFPLMTLEPAHGLQAREVIAANNP